MKTIDVTIINIQSKDYSFTSSDIKMHIFEKYSNIKSVLPRHKINTYIENCIKEVNGICYLITFVVIADFNNYSVRDQGFDKNKKMEIALTLSNKGFSFDYPDFYIDYLNLYRLTDKMIYEKERIDNQYVLTKYSSKDLTPKDYIGGFDLEIIFVEQLISYIEKGICFGYIGHRCRKVWVDKLMCEICLPIIKPEDFACWLTSTDGRHFGDYIKDYVEDNNIETVKSIILDALPTIHDKAIIYNSPEHKGNYKSTLELFEKYKDMGIMLSDSL